MSELHQKNESIIITGLIRGIPTDTTLEEYVEYDHITIGTFKIERFDSGIVRIKNIKVLKTDLDDLVSNDVEILINMISGRKSGMYNLISCDIIQKSISTLKGKTHTLNGKLINED